jgi:hypothetical protein
MPFEVRWTRGEGRALGGAHAVVEG